MATSFSYCIHKFDRGNHAEGKIKYAEAMGSPPQIDIRALQEKGSRVIPRKRIAHLIADGKLKSVMVPPDQFEALVEAYEDLEDIRIYEERKNEPTIPWEEAFPDRKKNTRKP
jgi:hypothetical protein